MTDQVILRAENIDKMDAFIALTGDEESNILSCLLAQAQYFARRRGEWPVMALDDLASELDRHHQRRILERLLSSGAQVFITGTEPPMGLADTGIHPALFHVEQGTVQPVPGA